MQGESGYFFRNIFDLNLESQRVLLKPAQTGVGCSPAIIVFAKARDSAVVNDVAFRVAPAAVDDLIDDNLINVAGDDPVDEFSGVATGDTVFEEGGDINDCGGVADSVVFMLMRHLIDADGVVAGPFFVIQALAKGEGPFVKCSSYWHGVPC